MKNANPPNSTTMMPALQLEQALGLRGIGHRYTMPDGESADSLEQKFFSVFIADGTGPSPRKAEVAHSYANLLAKLNPAIADLQPPADNFAQNVAFIRGMTAGYNRDDIEFFLYVPEEIRRDICGQQKQFLEAAGLHSLNWAPSPKTFEAIKAQLAAKHGKDWHSTNKVSYNGLYPRDPGARLFVEIDFQQGTSDNL